MTTYHVVESKYDRQACQRLMDQLGVEGEISFPTIMALDSDNELVGFLATRPADDMIMAGPLIMAPGRPRPFTALNLIEQYRNVMRNLKIKSIVFSIDDSDSFIKKGIERWFPEMEPYATDGGVQFYTWPIDDEDR